MTKDTQQLFITDCPRDAMQGLPVFIPTERKIKYIQKLLDVNFEFLDCGSFVSPKVIPQMADSDLVLGALDKSKSKTKVSVIVANNKGAKRACSIENVDLLGFPFSVSEIFQLNNTNATREEGLNRINSIKKLAEENNKKLFVYLSMAFGNKYNEEWSMELLLYYVEKIVAMGIDRIKISDTVAIAAPHKIENVFSHLIKNFPSILFEAHLHTAYDDWHDKMKAAYNSGCIHFDGAIQGYGGCPMSKSDLIGNMPTEKLINFAQMNELNHGLNLAAFEGAFNNALTLFGN